MGHVDVLVCFNAEHLSFVIKYTMHDSITEGFCDNKFYIFLRNIQFLCNIWKVDVRIGEGNFSETNTDNNLIEAKNQSVKSILLVSGLIVLNKAIEAV